MALSYKTRRWLSLLILLIGLPLYVIIAITILNLLGRPNILIELLVYLVLGIAWALPFKSVFKGIGQPDPAADPKSKGEAE